jgi:hypothetical protein
MITALFAAIWTLGAASLTYHACAMDRRSVPSLQTVVEKRRQAATERLKRATKFSMVVGEKLSGLEEASRHRDRLDLALSAIKKCGACNGRRPGSLDF